MGSQLVEFVIALLVGVLAILASLLCIGFLLVEPIKSPPSEQPTVSLGGDGCGLVSREEPLPLGCSQDGNEFVSVSSCSQQECVCDQTLLAQGSLCCCRATQHTEVEGIECPQETLLSGMTTATACGCTACDDIEVTITLTVEAMRSNDPIAAAQIFRVNGPASDNDLTLIGITDNTGRFRYREFAAVRTVVLRVQAPEYIPQLTPPINLQPNVAGVSHRVVLMPGMEISVGMGDSPLNLRLGNMFSVTAPAGSFTNTDGEPYNGQVIFRGGVVDIMDEYEVATIPSSSFYYTDPETEELVPFAIVLGMVLYFEDVSGTSLQASNLKLSLSNDKNLPPDLFILTFEPSVAGGWVIDDNFSPVESAREKRQQGSPIVFDGRASSLSAISVVASDNAIDCWLQGRGFQSNGVTPTSNTVMTVRHCAIIDSVSVFVQFTAETGQALNSTDGLELNALCLPVVCQDVMSGRLEARQNNGNSLLPISFDATAFSENESVPVALGTVFLFEELAFSRPNNPHPFYRSVDECRIAASQTNTAAERNSYFKFDETDASLQSPTNSDMCYIKIQIRACYDANTVTVRSIAITGQDVQPPEQRLVTVHTPTSTTDTISDLSGGGATEDATPFTTTETPTEMFACNAAVATQRAACIPYVCGTTLHLRVSTSPDNSALEVCEVTDRSILLQTSFFAKGGTSVNLPIMTDQLLTEDFNNPDLGLYSDAGTTDMASDFAEQRCNAGLGEEEFSSVLDPDTGIAAVFSCFDQVVSMIS